MQTEDDPNDDFFPTIQYDPYENLVDEEPEVRFFIIRNTRRFQMNIWSTLPAMAGS